MIKFGLFFSLLMFVVHQSTQLHNNFLKPDPCKPNTPWFDGCNTCTCDDQVNGLDGFCTEIFCPRPDNCEPGLAYFTGTEWCFCHSNPTKDVCMKLNI